MALLRNVVTQHVRCECGNWADQRVRLQRLFRPNLRSEQHLASAPRTLGRVSAEQAASQTLDFNWRAFARLLPV